MGMSGDNMSGSAIQQEQTRLDSQQLLWVKCEQMRRCLQTHLINVNEQRKCVRGWLLLSLPGDPRHG